MSTSADRTYTTTVGSQTLELPLVPLSDDLTIALLICVDLGVTFAETAGRELAELMRPAEPEIVVSVATMGIPLAIEASRALGLDDYVILHKTPKIHLGETWSEPVYSITTDKPQRLRMDPARVAAVRGRRVAVVDDVISTGASLSSALRLVRRMDAEPLTDLHLAKVALSRNLVGKFNRGRRVSDIGREARKLRTWLALIQRPPVLLGPIAETGDETDPGDPDFTSGRHHRQTCLRDEKTGSLRSSVIRRRLRSVRGSSAYHLSSRPVSDLASRPPTRGQA